MCACPTTCCGRCTVYFTGVSRAQSVPRMKFCVKLRFTKCASAFGITCERCVIEGVSKPELHVHCANVVKSIELSSIIYIPTIV